MTHFRRRFARWLSTSHRFSGFILKHPALISSLLVAGLVVGVRQAGGLQPWELLTYDQMLRLRPAQDPDPRLLVVTVTEQDIQEQQRWPLSDQVIARLLERLQQYRPRTIGLDIYRDISHPPGQSDLLKQLQAPNLIAIRLLGDAAKDGVPAPPGTAPDRVGFSDVVLDPDAVVRRNFLFATSKGERFYSFPLRLSLHYLADQHLTVTPIAQKALQIGERVFPTLDSHAGGYQTLDDRGYQIMLNYRSGKAVARQVTLGDVLHGRIDPAWVKNKLVLIGTTAPSVKDLFVTPFNLSDDKNPEMGGVLVHAQKVSQILGILSDGQSVIWYWPEPIEIAWIWIWALLGGVLGWRLRHPVWLGLSVAIGGVSLFGICLGTFLQAGWIPFVAPMSALIGSSVAILAYRLLYNALHDELTGLPNRTLFINQVQRVINRGRQLNPLKQVGYDPSWAVLSLGLDNFKAINDSFGPHRADELLITIAKRLKSGLKSGDHLARVGGDEFAILLPQIQDIDEVAHLADYLQKQIKQPFVLQGQEVFTSTSVGIVLNELDRYLQPEDVLRDAQTAMNQAKASGKARYQVFMPGMRVQVMTRLQLETDLRRAIERQEFQLHYQPVVSLLTGKISGFEALLRWQNPQRGFVHPMEFISVAEETDLIIPIGQWVIEEACHQVQIWQHRFPQLAPLVVSVNLSSKQFAQANLVEQIEQTLRQTGLNGHNLKLEITESIAMTDVETTIAMLMRLKALDLQLSIDDFGTGYSSLSYLHRFPTDTIKVDRSFVSRMGSENENSHIVQTVIMLGHNLGMDIVAEGVETTGQLAQLRALKCEYGQGYFFSKPLPSEAIEQLLKTDPQW
jgi:diguanylate cyclase (GGDEF)-like protein